MNIAVGCALGCQVLLSTANFTFKVLVNRVTHQEIMSEQLVRVAGVPREETT
jgi:hypothetical protein